MEEMSDRLENEAVVKSEALAEIIIDMCMKEVAPEEREEVPERLQEETEEELQGKLQEEAEEAFDEEDEAEAFSQAVKKKRKRVGRVRKAFAVMLVLSAVIAVAAVAHSKLSVPEYVPTTTQPTTQTNTFNPLLDAITAGNQKLIEELITNSLLLSQDVLKLAIEYADKISYDSIRRIAEEVKNKYGSTGLDPLIEGAIFGDIGSVEEKLKNKDESEMTPAEKLAYFFITSLKNYEGQ